MYTVVGTGSNNVLPTGFNFIDILSKDQRGESCLEMSANIVFNLLIQNVLILLVG